jgi:hypothetical protein
MPLPCAQMRVHADSFQMSGYDFMAIMISRGLPPLQQI